MAYTSSRSSSSSDNEVCDDSYCSKSCRKNTENLNTKINKLNEELRDYETDLYNYKRGLPQVEARLVEFKVNETKFCERIRVLERDVEIKDNKIESLKNEHEEVKKEKDSIDHKIEKFDNASKDLDSLLGNQRLDKDKKGLGFNEYSDVPPPLVQVYSPPKNDLSWTGLPEFVNDTVTDYSRPTPSIDVPRDVSESVSFFEQRGSVGNVLSTGSMSKVKCSYSGIGSSLSKLSRKKISPFESKSLTIPGGIESSGTRNVSTSSIRKSLSPTRIGEEEGYSSTKGIEGIRFNALILSMRRLTLYNLS
ncbi:hypothetical protein Tco_1406233 [Tanacetum coccineum]